MLELLPKIQSPLDLHKLSDDQLLQVSKEIRDELMRVLSIRQAHFASNPARSSVNTTGKFCSATSWKIWSKLRCKKVL